jgi:hypothetical protein
LIKGILTPLSETALTSAISSFTRSGTEGGVEETDVATEELLFAVLGSAGLPLTVAVFVINIAVGGAVTTIVADSVAPLARLPIVHVTVPELLLQPFEADWNPTPLGSWSVAVTPVALLGPLLVTESV